MASSEIISMRRIGKSKNRQKNAICFYYGLGDILNIEVFSLMNLYLWVPSKFSPVAYSGNPLIIVLYYNIETLNYFELHNLANVTY